MSPSPPKKSTTAKSATATRTPDAAPVANGPREAAGAASFTKGDTVVYVYDDVYASDPAHREARQPGQIVEVIRDGDTPVTARVAWFAGGVSGPIALDELEAFDTEDTEALAHALAR